MINRIPRPVRLVLFLSLLGTCGLQVTRVATAEPVTVPLQKDVLKSQRVAQSRVGGVDVTATSVNDAALVGGNGVVEPRQRETRVAAQVTAVVHKVLVKEGDQVKAGDLLVTMNNAVETAAVQAAEAEVAAERANVDRAVRGVRVEDQDALAAETEAAKARAALARSVLERTQTLARSGAASAEELDRARQQGLAEESTVRALEARLRAARAGSRAEDVAFARARLAAAEARVAQARATLARLSVRAPTSGEVLQVKIREGELYSFQNAEPLMLIGDTEHLRVRMDVDERDIGRVALGADAYVTADAFGARKFAGTVVEVGRRFGRKNIRTDDPVERNDTKILEVVIELNDSTLLVPGQRVTSFVTSTPHAG